MDFLFFLSMSVFEGRWGNLLVPATCSAAVVPLTSFFSFLIPYDSQSRQKEIEKIESISGLDNVTYDFNAH